MEWWEYIILGIVDLVVFLILWFVSGSWIITIFGVIIASFIISALLYDDDGGRPEVRRPLGSGVGSGSGAGAGAGSGDGSESLESCPSGRHKGDKIYTLSRRMTDYSVDNLDNVKTYIMDELMDGISSDHLEIFRGATNLEKKDAIKIKELSDNNVKFFFCCPGSENCIEGEE